MNPDTTYLFYEMWVPKRFRGNKYSWPTIVATLISPIVKDEPGLVYWFVQEGPWFQFCFASHDPARIVAKIRKHQRRANFRTKRILHGTIGTALCGDRWNIKFGTKNEEERSVILVKSLHGVCQLYIHSLVKNGKRWDTETNLSRQNRHSNIFESYMHLIANISQAQFNVHLAVRTDWMHEGFRETKVVCHL